MIRPDFSKAHSSLKELNKNNVTSGSTIQPKSYIIDKFYRALGTTEQEINRLSQERLNKLATGYFLGSWNSRLWEPHSTITNFRIPEHYHVNAIEDEYITIQFYSNMRQGYKEVKGSDVDKYHNMVNTIKLKYDDFFLMSNSF